MSKKIKFFFAPLLALMLVFSVGVAAAPAEAATKPTATFHGSTKRYVKRNHTYKLNFTLRSNSYRKRSYGTWYGYRARFDINMYRNGKRVDTLKNWTLFSGTHYKSYNWYFGSGTYSRRAWYKMKYSTEYRTNVYSSYWYTARTKTIKFYVK